MYAIIIYYVCFKMFYYRHALVDLSKISSCPLIHKLFFNCFPFSPQICIAISPSIKICIKVNLFVDFRVCVDLGFSIEHVYGLVQSLLKLFFLFQKGRFLIQLFFNVFLSLLQFVLLGYFHAQFNRRSAKWWAFRQILNNTHCVPLSKQGSFDGKGGWCSYLGQKFLNMSRVQLDVLLSFVKRRRVEALLFLHGVRDFLLFLI
ncbi:hypothetical protein FGO68_gene15002 [Halteria grandinella]|uniref:Uncharacterized protein n=1 Tax=Halteria grandinella TaxID=5974 RepID=A0A8J8P6Q9_HALGN|nr:hypothetical protein FGO68_gene15002 [Halteria grandinella]